MKEQFLKRIISSFILIPISLFVIIKGSLIFNLFIVLCYLVSAYEWHKLSKGKVYEIFGFIFLTFSFYLIYRIRNDFNGEYFHLFFILIIVYQLISVVILLVKYLKDLKSQKSVQIKQLLEFLEVIYFLSINLFIL